MATYRLLAAFSMSIALLAGCATPRTLEQLDAEQMETLSKSVQDAAQASHDSVLGESVRAALLRGGGPERMRSIFAAHPKARDLLVSYLERQTGGDLHSGNSARNLDASLTAIESAGLLPSAEVGRLKTRLMGSVARGNLDGTFPVTLVDAAAFASLHTPEHIRIIADRSVEQIPKVLTNEERGPLLKAVLAYASMAPAEERARLQPALAQIQFKRSELDLLHAAFPTLAEQLRSKLYVRAQIRMRGGDRLVEDDIKAAASARLKGLTWTSGGAPDTPIVTIERIRHDERTTGERRETVTYAQHQVNLVYAALLMPRNASYSYEITSAGASIEYGYLVSVEGGLGERYERIVRGQASSDSVTCSNARITNVFGGVTAATFVANDDMASRCNRGQGKKMEELRTDVFREVVEALAAAPQLRGAATPD